MKLYTNLQIPTILQNCLLTFHKLLSMYCKVNTGMFLFTPSKNQFRKWEPQIFSNLKPNQIDFWQKNKNK